MAAAARIARSAFQVPRKGTTYLSRRLVWHSRGNIRTSKWTCLTICLRTVSPPRELSSWHSRKEAIQKTIAAMTLGKDVSALFPDVLKNIATHDLGQKKLVYLYLMYVPPPEAELMWRNYAKSHPELCILAVNTFVQVTYSCHGLVLIPGLWRSKSTCSSACNTDYGMYPCRQNGRLSRWTTTKDSQSSLRRKPLLIIGWVSVCEENSSDLCC